MATSTPWVLPQDLDGLTMPPLEDAHLPGAMALLDFSTLELLEMTISHAPVTG